MRGSNQLSYEATDVDIDTGHLWVLMFPGVMNHYVKNTMKFAVVADLEDPFFKVLWIQISPTRLPRGYSSILLGALYHLASANDSAFLGHLERCLSSIETRYSNCGLCLVGDFNRLQTTWLTNNYNLKQIVNFRRKEKEGST